MNSMMVRIFFTGLVWNIMMDLGLVSCWDRKMSLVMTFFIGNRSMMMMMMASDEEGTSRGGWWIKSQFLMAS